MKQSRKEVAAGEVAAGADYEVDYIEIDPSQSQAGATTGTRTNHTPDLVHARCARALKVTKSLFFGHRPTNSGFLTGIARCLEKR